MVKPLPVRSFAFQLQVLYFVNYLSPLRYFMLRYFNLRIFYEIIGIVLDNDICTTVNHKFSHVLPQAINERRTDIVTTVPNPSLGNRREIPNNNSAGDAPRSSLTLVHKSTKTVGSLGMLSATSATFQLLRWPPDDKA